MLPSNIKNLKIIFLPCIFGLITEMNAQINMKANEINFRTESTAGNATSHYGDFWISGGTYGDNMGWLTAERVYSNGLLYAEGDLSVMGTKNFIQLHPTDTNKVIKYIAIEAGEAITLVRGTASTRSGGVKITLPEHFSLVTSEKGPINVQVCPIGKPALLYVNARSKNEVEINLKSADYYEFGDIQFDFVVTGVRDGYENHIPIVDAKDMLKSSTINSKTQTKEKIKRLRKIAELEAKTKK